MIPERLVPGTEDWDLYFPEHRQRYDFFAPCAAGKSVLDAACGIGYGSRILAQAGALSVLGVDISGDALRLARQQFAHPAVAFAQKDVADLAGTGPFDLVVSFETIEHVPDPEFFLQAVRNVIRENGQFVCSTPNPNYIDKGAEKNPFHLSELPFTEFAALFGKYFHIEERYHQSHAASYHRHAGMLRELERLNKHVAFSRLLRFENQVRRLLGRETLHHAPLPRSLWNGIESDYYIAPLEQASADPVTYILVGRPKN